MDYGYYSAMAALDHTGLSLAALGVQIARGKLPSNQLDRASPSFHTNAFPDPNGPAELNLPSIEGVDDSTDGIICRSGDILLARVDRRFENKVAIVKSGGAFLSDCVLRLRCPKDEVSRVFRGLRSDGGRIQMAAMATGTGARHISKQSVLKIRV